MGGFDGENGPSTVLLFLSSRFIIEIIFRNCEGDIHVDQSNQEPDGDAPFAFPGLPAREREAAT
jgi:hypothetical protein